MPTLSSASRSYLWRLLALCALFPLLTGCCTIFSGLNQRISVQSDPEGARVFLNEVQVATTPGVAEVERREAYRHPVLRFEKEGYESANVPLRRNPNLWLIGDALLCIPFLIPGLVGGTIDFVSGAAFEFSPPKVRVVLPKKKEARDTQRVGELLAASAAQRALTE